MYRSINSSISKCLIQIVFLIAFTKIFYNHHHLGCIYRAYGDQDHQLCLGEFDQGNLTALQFLLHSCKLGIAQVRNSALICISCCLSVCEEASMLSVYCRKPALQLVIMSVLKKHIKFNLQQFCFKKCDTPISVILQFLFLLFV